MINYKDFKYNPHNSWILSQFSSLVYEDWEIVEKTLRGWSFSDFIFLDKSDTQAMIVWCDRYAIISFRGTDSGKDVMTDLNCDFTKWQYGQVHDGFLMAYMAIEEDLSLSMQKLVSLPVFVTGHSLGAALSVLCHIDLMTNGFNSINYNFGCPRVGDFEFSDQFYSDSIHRTVNNNDVVTDLPPELTGFKHVGEFHYFKENGNQDDNISWWGKKKDEWSGVINDIGEIGLDAVKDHSINEYVYRCWLNSV